MARIRSIKPEFWSSEQVMECSPNARLLFIGLWNFCDDEGRHPLALKQIRALIFPADDFSPENIRGMLAELSRAGLIKTYKVEGKAYFFVTGWQHQKIDRPQSAKYPGPFDERSTNDPGPLATDEGEDKGKDIHPPSGGVTAREGANGSKQDKRGSRLPEDWQLTEERKQAARKHGLTATDTERSFARFKNHFIAKPGKEGLKLNWDRTWENWCIRDAEQLGRAPMQALENGQRVGQHTIFVKIDTPQWEAWKAHRGGSCPSSSSGGWYFPSEWPPGQEQAA